MECVLKTREVAKAIEEKDWDRVLELRGSSFKVRFFNWKRQSFPTPGRRSSHVVLGTEIEWKISENQWSKARPPCLGNLLEKKFSNPTFKDLKQEWAPRPFSDLALTFPSWARTKLTFSSTIFEGTVLGYTRFLHFGTESPHHWYIIYSLIFFWINISIYEVGSQKNCFKLRINFFLRLALIYF